MNDIINEFFEICDSLSFLKVILLNQFVLLSVKGSDANKYLQSQFTGDLNKLSKNHYLFTSHCNRNGKVICVLFLFRYKDGFRYFLNKSLISSQKSELEKYAVFFDFNLYVEKDFKFLGIIGSFDNVKLLKKLFRTLPNRDNSIIHINSGLTILYFSFPIERFLLILDKKNFFWFINKSGFKVEKNKLWIALDIISEIPYISANHIFSYSPRNLNLINFYNCVSFEKGCFLGQEKISRSSLKKELNFNILHFSIYNFNSKRVFLNNFNENKKIINSFGSLICEVLIDNYLFIQYIINRKYLNLLNN